MEIKEGRFRCGNGVIHKEHGVGVIIAVGLGQPDPLDDKYFVRFDDSKEKVFSARSEDLASFPSRCEYILPK